MMTYISYFRDYIEKDGERKKAEEEARRRAAEEEARRKAAAVARALKWEAQGPGVKKGWKNRWNPFVIKNNQNERATVMSLRIAFRIAFRAGETKQHK